MKNRLKGIAMILVIIILIVFVAPRVFHFIKYIGADDSLRGIEFTKESRESAWSTEESDIEGWTMLDKINSGLQPIKGADSDGDGLTDKDEIEVYNSDPAKASTAGDLYDDGYKIANGMDINTVYDYKNDLTFDGNACNEVSLSALAATDFNAIVEEINNPVITGYDIYKAYDVYHFGGEMSIDVSGIEDIRNADVLVGPWHSGEMDKVKVKADGNKLTLNYEFNPANRYTVAIGKKQGGLNFKAPYHKFTFNEVSQIDLRETDFLYMHFFPFFSLFMDTKPNMYYVSTGDRIADERIKCYLLALASAVTDDHANVTDEDITEVSSEKMAILKGFASMFAGNELTTKYDKLTIPKYIFLWSESIIADESEYLAEIKDIKDYVPATRSDTGFDVEKDAFSFQNFATEYAHGGNCAGIAYYTAELFNTGASPSDGSYTSSLYEHGGTNVSWDISSDTSNETLTNPVLSDYKDSSFVTAHKGKDGILENLSSGEEEYTKMISSYWALANDKMDMGRFIYYINDSIGVYSWQMIEDMMDKLDNGEILILGMMDDGGCGHAVNIVNYTRSDDGNTVYFELYDNIFPRNEYKGSQIDNTLTVSKAIYEKGDKESFTYYYKPYDSCSYEYNSENNINGWKCFVVMDSSLNVLNEAY